MNGYTHSPGTSMSISSSSVDSSIVTVMPMLPLLSCGAMFSVHDLPGANE